jgi:hypothetical protein
MLKISVIDSRTVRRLVLEGTFITPWVGELRTMWTAANADLQGRQLVLDFKNGRPQRNSDDVTMPASPQQPRPRSICSPRTSLKEYGIDSVLSLGTFERFVFVLSVLERYTDQDCAVLLGRSGNDVREGRVGAFQQLTDFERRTAASTHVFSSVA